MSRPVIFGGGTLALLLLVAGWRLNEWSRSSEVPFEPRRNSPEAAPLCPWREPASDLQAFFPNATRYELETRILSGRRSELAERLGRAPTGDENALHIYRIYRDHTRLGAVLTRRVKGAYGGIELVLAVGADGRTRGLRLQRLREPESIARALREPRWLDAFADRRADSPWQLGSGLSDVPPEARASAEAVVEGARGLLILLATADDAPGRSFSATTHH